MGKQKHNVQKPKQGSFAASGHMVQNDTLLESKLRTGASKNKSTSTSHALLFFVLNVQERSLPSSLGKFVWCDRRLQIKGPFFIKDIRQILKKISNILPVNCLLCKDKLSFDVGLFFDVVTTSN